jgi:hypothetical protein
VTGDTPHRISVCPFGNDCGWMPEYPKGYRDPPWERTGIPSVDEERFGKIVLPARAAAFTESLNAEFDIDTYVSMMRRSPCRAWLR